MDQSSILEENTTNGPQSTTQFTPSQQKDQNLMEPPLKFYGPASLHRCSLASDVPDSVPRSSDHDSEALPSLPTQSIDSWQLEENAPNVELHRSTRVKGIPTKLKDYLCNVAWRSPRSHSSSILPTSTHPHIRFCIPSQIILQVINSLILTRFFSICHCRHKGR